MAAAANSPPNISRVDLVMGKIFQYLNDRDLDSCFQAYPYWRRDIRIERQNRQDVYPFLWTWFCKEHGKIDGCNEEQENPRNIHDDIRMKVGKYSSRRCVPLLFFTRRVAEDAEILFPGIQPTVITDEYRCLSKSDDFDDSHSSQVLDVRCELWRLVFKALRGNFPSSPLLILSEEAELLGCGEDLQLKHLSSLSHAITGYILPQYPGFEIRNFKFGILDDFLFPMEANIKGLLVISHGGLTLARVERMVAIRSIPKLAIGGYYSLSNSAVRNESIVAFCGENVETASLVVSPYDGVGERKLRLFQETTLLGNGCFAFVFNSFNVEEIFKSKLLETFKQLYPNIPLIGLRNRDIYGVDYLPGVSQEILISRLRTLRHAGRVDYTKKYKSVFILVSIKS